MDKLTNARAFVPGGRGSVGAGTSGEGAPAFVSAGKAGGKGFKASAAPFVPGGGMKANATPFVPGGGGSGVRMRQESFDLPDSLDDLDVSQLSIQERQTQQQEAKPFYPQSAQITPRNMPPAYPPLQQMQGGVPPPQPQIFVPPPKPQAVVGGGGQWNGRDPGTFHTLRQVDTRRNEGTGQLASKFISEALRMELQQRSLLTLAQVDPSAEAYTNLRLPEMINEYHTLFPLEVGPSDEDRPSDSLGVHTFIFKGISSTDGRAYALRRVDGRFVVPTSELVNAAQECIERWSVLSGHPGVILPRAVCVSKEVASVPSLFIVSDYRPAAISLSDAHQIKMYPGGPPASNAAEEVLWTYIVQLVLALRSAHRAGLHFLAASLHPSKLLLFGHNRISIGSVGMQEIIHGSPQGKTPEQLNREDIMAVGRTILALGCGVFHTASMEAMAAAGYTPELLNFVRVLLTPEEAGIWDVRRLVGLLADRAFDDLRDAHVYNDHLGDEMTREIENGRLLRILIKLGFLNERPEFVLDPQWAETGDRYLLKLFRDFVFHQVSDDGSPVIDWGHAIECLNKLDAGVPERILLLSRDEASMIVVSYADIKRCAEGAYGELVARELQQSK